MPGTFQCDIAIAGGGLAGGLIALALAERQPDLDVRLIEPESGLGGNHIWSFFDSDVAPEQRWLVEPLICHHWDRYDVAFPTHQRTLEAGYNSISSERLDAVVRARMKPERVIHAKALEIARESIVLADEGILAARLIIDARGPADLSCLNLGWQKFLGQQLRVKGGHGLARPIIMDAAVPQLDGYRFVYCLPFDAETVFVEDTYYSDSPQLGVETLRERIAEYADNRRWTVETIEREETGILPVAMGGNFDAYWASGGSTAKAGMRAGLFHPTTGYSLPDAVRLAVWIANSSGVTAGSVKAYAAALWAERSFYRLLDRMLLRAAEPGQRYKILERFYRLPPALIGRFYAGQSTLADKIRILSGRPPVPIGRALGAIMGRKG